MELSKTLFWDTDIQNLDYAKNAAYIIERVLSMGTIEDFLAIKEYYGKSKIKKIIKNIRYLDNKVMFFCSAYFDIPINNFRCYAIKRSNQAHWNY